jgi:integrase
VPLSYTIAFKTREAGVATIRKLRGKWQAQVRRKGAPPQAKSFTTKQEAERWARSLEAEYERNGGLPDYRTAEQTTVADLLTRYRDEITPTKGGADKEAVRIRVILRHPIRHVSLRRLSSKDVAGYRDERLKSVGPQTVIHELKTLSHAIEIARKEWGVVMAENPCRLVRRPKLPQARDRRLRDGERERLLAGCRASRNRELHDLVVMAMETGMRRGELLSLRWEHVDLGAGVAHLPKTKNGHSRDVPLTLVVRELLALRRGEVREGALFTSSENSVRLAWERARRRAGIEGLRFHDLRHEAVSSFFERGLNVVEVATISGHRELRMLQRYTHLKAVDLLGKLEPAVDVS